MAINEVVLGAGTRRKRHVIGGERSLPLHPGARQKNLPVIAQDVFDIPIHLPGHVREFFGDAMNDPADWARLSVKRYKADMVTLHMVSADPKGANVSVSDAVKKLEDVLSAVKVPLIIGGCGSPEKDPELLEKACEVCSGERVLLSSVNGDMDYGRVVKAAIEHGHAVLSLIPQNLGEMSMFNRALMRLGLSKNDIVMDLFTGGVGYGLEYTISAMERCRLSALAGDTGLAFPIVSAPSNSWSAREAWMKKDEWGPREKRGPLWEAVTAEATLLSGADLFMMLHPLAISSLKEKMRWLHTR